MDISQQQPNEDIVRKIQKLLALANNNPNEHQASAAAAKAQELLERYNLDLAVIGSADVAGSREDKRLKGGLYKWQRDVWEAVARLNWCMYWSEKGLTKGSTYTHRVLGRTVNVLSTKLMAEYLEQAIERIARAEYDNVPALYFGRPAVAFREGMAERIVERINSRRWKAESEARAQKRQQEREQAANPSSSVALTILDVAERESEGNADFLYGEGYSARRKLRMAESERQANEMRAKMAEDDRRWREENPELAAELDREAEAERKREERNARRRKGPRYHERKVRHGAHYDGYARGADVSLEKQVDEGRRSAGSLPA